MKKILIVEDEKDFLWILRQAFEEEKDFSVSTASDGEEGLKKAEAENPDLMLIDINMPRMDGLTMAKQLKDKGIKSDMIFLTNLSDAEHISEAMEISSSGYIVKSEVQVNTIVERVKEKLGLGNAT